MVEGRRKPLRDLIMPKTTSIRPSSFFDTSFTYEQAMKESNNPASEIIPEVKPMVKPIIPENSAGASMTESKSTACIPCSKGHISAISGALNESIRFAKEGGTKHPEVIDRIGIATDELAAMERIDLAPYKIQQLQGEEREFANWIVDKTRDLRHSLDNIFSVEDLERTAKEAADFRDQFLPRFWNLLQNVSKK
jgi:hypothetical protein